MITLRRIVFACGLVAVWSSAAPSAAQPPRANHSPGVHQVILNDVRLWYRIAGKARGVPVVYVHGGPGEGSESFAELVGPALENGHRMVYWDQRGAGHSERPWNEAYSIDLLVSDLEQLRQTLGARKIALIGHSFGTIIALEYAAKFPEHVSRVVLAASVPDIPAAQAAGCDRLAQIDPAAHARAIEGASSGTTCDLFKAYATNDQTQKFIRSNMFPDPAIDALVQAADARGGQKNEGQVGRVLFRQGLLSYRFTKADQLTMPVLIIAGGRDFQAAIGPQQALAKRLPHGKLVEFPSSGHFVFAEQPRRFVEEVSSFLARSAEP